MTTKMRDASAVKYIPNLFDELKTKVPWDTKHEITLDDGSLVIINDNAAK